MARLALLGLLLLTVAHHVSAAPPPAILVFSKTLDYRHDSIPTAIRALTEIAATVYTPTFSEDSSLFRSTSLPQFAAIVFLSNSEGLLEGDPEVLDQEGKDALVEWLGKGGALVGLHAGTACLFRMPAFGVAMGSWFDYHPTISNVTFNKVQSHVTVDMLPDEYNTYEEAYNFLTDPRSVNATVLLTPNSSSYEDPTYATAGHYQGSPHPSVWLRDEAVDLGNGTDGGATGRMMTGRLWMTSLGHTNETWESEVHREHVREGIRWALEGGNNSFLNSTASSSSSTPTPPTPSTSPSSTPNPTTSSPSSSSAQPSQSSLPASSASLQAISGILSLLTVAVGMWL